MQGIVLELQAETLDGNSDILSLLRKAYFVAKKLKLKEFEDWLNCEMDGYTSSKQVPTYRKVLGEVKAWNPYHGWIPVLLKKGTAGLEEHCVMDSISSLVNVYNSASATDEGAVVFQFTPSLNRVLSKGCDFDTIFHLEVGKNQLYSIMDKIRNIILDWAITLEESGIVGEGLSFSEREKELAISSPIINEYTANFYQNTGTVQFQQGTERSSQSGNNV